MDNSSKDINKKITDVRNSYVLAVIKSIERLTKELNDELKNKEPLLSATDRRFDRVRGLLNDAPKTLETLASLSKEGDVTTKEKPILRNKNGNRVNDPDQEKKIFV